MPFYFPPPLPTFIRDVHAVCDSTSSQMPVYLDISNNPTQLDVTINSSGGPYVMTDIENNLTNGVYPANPQFPHSFNLKDIAIDLGVPNLSSGDSYSVTATNGVGSTISSIAPISDSFSGQDEFDVRDAHICLTEEITNQHIQDPADLLIEPLQIVKVRTNDVAPGAGSLSDANINLNMTRYRDWLAAEFSAWGLPSVPPLTWEIVEWELAIDEPTYLGFVDVGVFQITGAPSGFTQSSWIQWLSSEYDNTFAPTFTATKRAHRIFIMDMPTQLDGGTVVYQNSPFGVASKSGSYNLSNYEAGQTGMAHVLAWDQWDGTLGGPGGPVSYSYVFGTVGISPVENITPTTTVDDHAENSFKVLIHELNHVLAAGAVTGHGAAENDGFRGGRWLTTVPSTEPSGLAASSYQSDAPVYTDLELPLSSVLQHYTSPEFVGNPIEFATGDHITSRIIQTGVSDREIGSPPVSSCLWFMVEGTGGTPTFTKVGGKWQIDVDFYIDVVHRSTPEYVGKLPALLSYVTLDSWPAFGTGAAIQANRFEGVYSARNTSAIPTYLRTQEDPTDAFRRRQSYNLTAVYEDEDLNNVTNATDLINGDWGFQFAAVFAAQGEKLLHAHTSASTTTFFNNCALNPPIVSPLGGLPFIEADEELQDQPILIDCGLHLN